MHVLQGNTVVLNRYRLTTYGDTMLKHSIGFLLGAFGVLFNINAAQAERLIVTLEPGVSSDTLVRVKSAAAGANAVEKINRYRHLPQLALVTLPAKADTQQMVADYKQMPGVKAVEIDSKVRKALSANDPSFNQQWHLQATPGLNAVSAWDNTTGDPQVVIAVIDTGLDYLHDDIASNVWQNTAEISGDGIDNDGNGYIDDVTGINPANGNVDPIDEDGHGTLVAGIIGASTNNNFGVAGINWQVKLLPCRFMDANGDGFVSDAIECLDYLLDLKLNRGVNIVASNNSWGSSSYSQALYNAIAAHNEAGILFVASAGNDNTQAPYYPAAFNLPNIISVAAHQQNGAKADFSNYGRSWVHLSAPGTNISTTDRENTYSQASGTSMSAPMVTAVAGLLKAAEPQLTLAQLRARLLVSVQPASDDIIASETVTGGLLLASGDGQAGALNCVNQQLQRRILPVSDSVFLPQNGVLDIRVLSLDCDGNSISTAVTAGSQGSAISITDDGLQTDDHAADGMYNGRWTFDGNDTILYFPDGEVQVRLRNDDFCDVNNVSQIPQAECRALVQLYYDTRGQSWLKQDNWLQSATPCSWFGVSCDAGRVSSIVLPENGLVGILPDGLTALSALAELDLSFNSLQGGFPASLLQLTNLRRLLLWSNAFDGNIPAAISNLTALTELDLSFNRFSGALPATLADLTQLRQLFVENNQLSANIPAELGLLGQLQILWLENNDFSGTLPASLVNLTQLRALSFAGTDLCAPATAEFSNWLAQLEELYINSDCDNTAPVVSAGIAQTVNSGATVQLHASATDAEFNVLSYRWQQLSGPAVSLSEPQALSTRFTAPTVTTSTALVFRFTADDGTTQSSAEVTITVSPTSGAGGSGDGGGSGGGTAPGWLLILTVLLGLRLGSGR